MGNEVFYHEASGRKADADIHEAILADGDDEAAAMVSVRYLVERRKWPEAKALRFMGVTKKAWDESKHPREPSGTEVGGQFASAEGAAPAKELPHQLDARMTNIIRRVKDETGYGAAIVTSMMSKDEVPKDDNTLYRDNDFIAWRSGRIMLFRPSFTGADDKYIEAVIRDAIGVQHAHVESIQRDEQRIMGIAGTVARDLGYDHRKIYIRNDRKTFTLNGKQFDYAGAAYINDGSGKIELYSSVLKNADDDTIKGVTAHEVMHHKYEKVMLAPLMTKLYDGDAQTRLRNDDGVSRYSGEWWTEFKAGKATTAQAMHETMAEMARLHYTTGIIQGTPIWRNYYHDANEIWRALNDPKQGSFRLRGPDWKPGRRYAHRG